MFFPEEESTIEKAVNILEKSEKYKKVVGKKVAQAVVSGKEIYLNSILYISDKLWSIWINNKLFDQKEWNGKIAINSITHDTIRMTMLVDDIDSESYNWRKKVNLTGDSIYTANDYPITITLLGEQAASIELTLKSNQTFKLGSMEIMEGDR